MPSVYSNGNSFPKTGLKKEIKRFVRTTLIGGAIYTLGVILGDIINQSYEDMFAVFFAPIFGINRITVKTAVKLKGCLGRFGPATLRP
jgi:hypothetical protein